MSAPLTSSMNQKQFNMSTGRPFVVVVVVAKNDSLAFRQMNEETSVPNYVMSYPIKYCTHDIAAVCLCNWADKRPHTSRTRRELCLAHERRRM